MSVFLVSILGKVVSMSGVYVRINEHQRNNFNNEWTQKTLMRLPCALLTIMGQSRIGTPNNIGVIDS